MTTSATATPFRMTFDPMTIEHFGLRLYSHLPPVLNELISNAYDADAAKVEVSLPNGAITQASEVVVRDFGHGMNADELQEEYLVIGRSRRGRDSSQTMSKSGSRKVTGRKGLGKLSVFGVADEMELRSVKDGKAVCIRLSFPAMREWAERMGNTHYQPDKVEERSGPSRDASGVEVRLRKLRRSSPINTGEIRRGLARRLTVFGPSFEVKINGKALGPGDRLNKEDCADEQCWDVNALPSELEIENGLKVSGWIGFLDESSQTNRGIDIFATNKAVELGSYFNYSSTHAQFARAHVVGEIHADFLDDTQDLVSTARNSVVWEAPQSQTLERWGQRALKYLFDEWVKLRRQKKEEEVIKTAKFDVWLKGRTQSEQRVARRMIKLLAADDAMEPSSLVPLLEHVKASVESVAFRELIEKIEEQGLTAKALMELFADWRVIEAREHLKLADGRLAAIQQLDRYIDEGALEVQEIQPIVEQNLWMLDGTWSEATGQTTYTELLRRQFPDDPKLPTEDRRLDILGVSASGFLTIVELKRPEATLSRKYLTQIEEYVDWAENNIVGSGPDAPAGVRGLLIVGKLNASLRGTVKRLEAHGIRVETFRDLRERAKTLFRHTNKYYKGVAPEYTSEARKAVKSLPVSVIALPTKSGALVTAKKK